MIARMSDDLDHQYGTTERLERRGSLHDRYSNVPWFAWVAERMDLPPDAKVLDVGAGAGWFWRAAGNRLPNGLHLTLSDRSPGMVEAARENVNPAPFASLGFAVADALALPFPDATFDAVVAMHMLYHVADPEAGITEMRRVLRPGGTLFVTANGAEDLGALHDLLVETFGPRGADPVRSLLTLDGAEELLADFGTVERHDLSQTYRIDDIDAALAYLTSFPPGDGADEAARSRLAKCARRAFEPQGVLPAVRETGLLVAQRAP